MDPRSHRWAMHTSVHVQYVLVEYYKARHTMSVVGMKGFEKLFKWGKYLCVTYAVCYSKGLCGPLGLSRVSFQGCRRPTLGRIGWL